MNVELLFFAALRECVTPAQQRVELPADVHDVATLQTWLTLRYPALHGKWSSVRVAVNECFVADEHALSSGDVVAFIPPVSGG